MFLVCGDVYEASMRLTGATVFDKHLSALHHLDVVIFR